MDPTFFRSHQSVKEDIIRDITPEIAGLIEKYNFNAHSCFLTYIGYRVWNAVKAVFGKSDWQKAVDLHAGDTKKEIKGEILTQGNEAIFNRVFGSSKVEEGLKKVAENHLNNVLAKLKVLNKFGRKVDGIKYQDAIQNIRGDKEKQLKTLITPMLGVFKPEFNSIKEFIISTLTTIGAPKEVTDFVKTTTTENVLYKLDQAQALVPLMLPLLGTLKQKVALYKDQFIDALEFDDKKIEQSVKADLKKLELQKLGPALLTLEFDLTQVLQFVMKITKNEEPSKIKVLGIREEVLETEEDSATYSYDGQEIASSF